MMRTCLTALLLAGLCRAAALAEPVAGLQYTPAPLSTLVSRNDLVFELPQARQGGSEISVLAYRSASGERTPVAWLSVTHDRSRSHVAIRTRTAPGAVRVATLEHLYALAMRQDPLAQFCFSGSGQPCDAVHGGRPHAQVLVQIAAARQEALLETGLATRSVPWRSVTLQAAAAGRDPDVVAVRIADGSAPMIDANVFFNRAPHSSCRAKTSADGLARCRLVDQHGDDDDAASERRTRVLAVFPGEVRKSLVLLPTTQVFRRTR